MTVGLTWHMVEMPFVLVIPGSTKRIHHCRLYDGTQGLSTFTWPGSHLPGFCLVISRSFESFLLVFKDRRSVLHHVIVPIGTGKPDGGGVGASTSSQGSPHCCVRTLLTWHTSANHEVYRVCIPSANARGPSMSIQIQLLRSPGSNRPADLAGYGNPKRSHLRSGCDTPLA